jgi:hypothetical protein
MMAIGHVDQVGKVVQLGDNIIRINCSLLISRSARVPPLSFTELQSRDLFASTTKQWGKNRATGKDHGII